MNIAFTDEQHMLYDTAVRLAEKLATGSPNETDLDYRLPPKDVEDQWQQIVDLGVPSFRSPELSGIESSGVETMIVVEQMARALTAAPVLGQGVLVPELLDAAGARDAAEAVALGQLRLAPTFTRDLADFASLESETVCFDTAGASQAVVLDTSGETRRLLVWPLCGDPLPGLDLTTELRRPLPGAATGDAVHELGEPIQPERWQRVHALALAAVSADLVGVMQGALDDAVRYVGDRVQFGAPIGSFQAVQHLLADALIRVEGARSCLWHAAWGIDHLPPQEALLAARTAKAYASAAGRDVVEASVQVFGGIAITWGHLSHIRLRRTLLHRRLLGEEACQFDAITATRLANPEIS